MFHLKESVCLLCLFLFESAFGGIDLSSGQTDESFLRQMQIGNLRFSSGYTYTFRNGSRCISDGSDYQAVQSAFQTWLQEPSSSLWAVETSARRGFTPGRMNGQNDISWISPTEKNTNPWKTVLNLPERMLAAVMMWVNPSTGCVLERDLYFNDVSVDWRTASDGLSAGGYWVERIALHEIGHLFGLRDIYNSGQKGWESWMGDGNEGLAMYGYSYWQDESAGLQWADIAAMALAHPAVPEPRSMPIFALGAAVFFITRKV